MYGADCVVSAQVKMVQYLAERGGEVGEGRKKRRICVGDGRRREGKGGEGEIEEGGDSCKERIIRY
jgi:hypothetical protein